ncbi:MAG: hypothetical protein VXW91_08870 [Pseudomonadota bacterium]|nr:hypothetical protein [Pseudomonadota bacterium]MEC8664312.1 hypothetical protein [Pseudomonadota bacterium]
MQISKRKTVLLSLLGTTLIGMTACVTHTIPHLRHETAKRLAMPSFMLERHIEAEPFMLTAWERIHNRGGAATVYVDGDGLTWSGTETDSHDPTPTNPVALHLATRDLSKNVIMLARPCHYTGLADGTMCSVEGWTQSRFSPETVGAMNSALDNIKRRYNISEFNFVGYDGGATMVSLLAAERDDVKTIRTVAGKLNYSETELMKDEDIDHFDAITVATKISDIPQQHFIGEWDDFVQPHVYDSYKAASGNSTCVKASIVKETTHDKGWVSRWPELLKAPLNCEAD